MATDQQDQPPQRRSRLEDEVIEILHRADRPPTLIDRARRLRARPPMEVRPSRSRNFLHRVMAGLDDGGWLLACLAAAIVAFIVRDASPLLARVCALIAVGCLVVPIVRSFWRPSGATGPKRWRGREIDLLSTRPEWIDRVWRGRRRPPR